jgi:hypothetical protein
METNISHNNDKNITNYIIGLDALVAMDLT